MMTKQHIDELPEACDVSAVSSIENTIQTSSIQVMMVSHVTTDYAMET